MHYWYDNYDFNYLCIFFTHKAYLHYPTYTDPDPEYAPSSLPTVEWSRTICLTYYLKRMVGLMVRVMQILQHGHEEVKKRKSEDKGIQKYRQACIRANCVKEERYHERTYPPSFQGWDVYDRDDDEISAGSDRPRYQSLDAVLARNMSFEEAAVAFDRIRKEILRRKERAGK